MSSEYFVSATPTTTSPQELVCRTTLAKKLHLNGRNHPDTLASIGELGTILRCANKLDEAEQSFRIALRGWRHILSSEHPEALGSASNLALVLLHKGIMCSHIVIN